MGRFYIKIQDIKTWKLFSFAFVTIFVTEQEKIIHIIEMTCFIYLVTWYFGTVVYRLLERRKLVFFSENDFFYFKTRGGRNNTWQKVEKDQNYYKLSNIESDLPMAFGLLSLT